MGVHSYKELTVWQKAIALVKNIYGLTKNFPQNEQFGIVSQMRRAAVSIPSNIAEGYGRKSPKEYKQFYSIAYGSALELDTQLLICRELGFINFTEHEKADGILQEVIKMLYVMTYKR
ncbi:hypothetical protein A3J33_02895 [candidate division WWE3 bacterium RIFCSPLOWO2_02_FULL_53_10]|uniref:Four helix bundle protein n=2 Tax=Katanobacteria TaxID=422282 RepID=A0A1F4WLT1_UNCKA|nr:MAG: hypothetical protein A2890_01515 [candidate division WWE3 bacterium RIFCSPLOWO2_01_FULL_53_14]OGC70341.1 MAG: hypothetical protein A3J33_02895 [candidate division WWE3 bacterium RIFCSPLOWO2_02_FULL_53_10]